MGPRSEERGNRACSDASAVAGCFNGAALPRSAETERIRALYRRRTRFNGAALRGARKRNVARWTSPPTTLLQWGRALEERGNDGCEPVASSAGIAASMGPRSEERGNSLARPSSVLASPLQWGRAPRSAETTIRRLFAVSRQRFNGAALRERGNHDDVHQPRCAPDASMGPRFRGARKLRRRSLQ